MEGRQVMFGKNKGAIITTNLIVKVRKYKDDNPLFSFYNKAAIADDVKASEAVIKLNELAQLETEENWQTEYYSVPMTL